MIRKLFGVASVLAALFLTGWFVRQMYYTIAYGSWEWDAERLGVEVVGILAGIVCLVVAIAAILRRQAIDRLVDNLVQEAGAYYGTSEHHVGARKALLFAILRAGQTTSFSSKVFEGVDPRVIDELAALFHKNSTPKSLRAALALEGGKKWLKEVTASA